ncbi:MAG: bi-domain-containing oxidoreductase [Rhodanobacteraceae bacterium]|nr:bi-domain-containing oxidoreductase [Rhodanobacteraceae bacterium]
MKQVLQNLNDGTTTLVEVPCPAVPSRGLLICTSVSLVSAGTERMMVAFGKANWLSKARQQPDKVRMVLEKVRTDGLLATVDAVRSKLDQPLAPGYCNVGRVLASGGDLPGFAPGDRVVSNGKHAEIVTASGNLCARIPDALSDEQAAFTVLAAIGLQGVRLVQPTLGECVVVTGLGLIGLLTVQMLRANGCRVMGIDVDATRLALARQFGAEVVVNVGAGEDALSAAERFSRGQGVDAVLLTASTQSSDPVHQAARMCRKRGRIVLVGVTGLELSRADFYEKELSFQVSCSYGPGRYDPAYEEQGHDYPIGFVRWTEQRNFEAVLDLMAAGSLDVGPLISHRFAFTDAPQAYELLASPEPSLGILLRYPPEDAAPATTVDLVSAGPGIAPAVRPGGQCRLAVIGAGNYAGRVLIPALRAGGAVLDTLVSAQGVSAAHYGRKHGFRRAGTDAAAVIAAEDNDAVVIATRHNDHAAQVIAALRAGKHVFVEKPLCLTLAELEQIQAALVGDGQHPAPLLMVGFNRRFAPLVQRAQALLAGLTAPRAVSITVNAGAIPPEHWTQDLRIGGGRIVGEACHFIDLARHLVGHRVLRWDLVALDGATRDSVSLQLQYQDGSIATIQYLANGHRGVPKERIEVYCGGRVLGIDNFRSLRGHGFAGFGSQGSWRQDKGQQACAAAFIQAIREGKASPIAADEIFESSRIAIEAQQRALAALQP